MRLSWEMRAEEMMRGEAGEAELRETTRRGNEEPAAEATSEVEEATRVGRKVRGEKIARHSA